ncbi:cysteine-rich venom protein-like [Carettochelys insculpta]|uniref:cysteine-rich venom protein-like n=1 Tax=Carettochelys insculpta TaxID=44489 RepID=UPI003EC15211
MILLVPFLGLAAVVQQTAGQTLDVGALSTDNVDQQMEIVNKHNSLRRGVNPTASNMLKMEWSPEAAENARSWANECKFEHSPTDRRKTTVECGENLYMSTTPDSWSDAIQDWYNEEKDFIYGKGPTTPEAVVGHYTQVVWYSSYQLGCAVAFCPGSEYSYYFVCQYCPSGNYEHKINTPYTLGPACGDCPNDCDNGLCTNPCKYQDAYKNCDDLKKSPGCEHPMVKQFCPASCLCTMEIK